MKQPSQVGQTKGQSEWTQDYESPTSARVLELAGVPESLLVEVLVLAAKADRHDYVQQVIDEVKRRASRDAQAEQRSNGAAIKAR